MRWWTPREEEWRQGTDERTGQSEHLTALAFGVSNQLEKLDVTEGHLTFRAIYKGVCFAADAMLRLHPESCHHAPWGRRDGIRRRWPPWPASYSSDGCVALHYFALDEVPPEERQFRFIIANLHCVHKARIAQESRRSGGH